MIWVRVYDMPFHVCLIILSSPFLLVFDDDHVTCYRDHMMLQVTVLMHRVGVGPSLGCI